MLFTDYYGKIKARPEMYTGKTSLVALVYLLDGIDIAAEKMVYMPTFKYWLQTKYNRRDGIIPMILERSGSDEEGMGVFFEEFDLFLDDFQKRGPEDIREENDKWFCFPAWQGKHSNTEWEIRVIKHGEPVGIGDD
ncbi:hypothetical protein [Rubellicoccus peritrichatus]|uniref:Uncharacterized protein n=1 Tax=Rubellicoccus peritrichatus TaxID=3080537 RepID=A0AAQ3LAG2_9BACT|nr:hypothetical protein [Puniceicoccus sp. CR14]WOO40345.1 hypothetical protein RZN69_17135 [Puniceicoccus sp. CR14]